ncbi:MAG TPA: O-antigen ligase family protein [Terriglobia bacterium]|jgi:O-antigen ligase
MTNPANLIQERPLVSKICRVAFCLYVVFMLAGSAMPFQDDDAVSAMTVSNPINQVVDSVIPLVCLVCLWPKRRQALEILSQKKYFVLFLLWCAISVTWSESPLMSVKASIRIIGSTIVALSFFVHSEFSEDALKYLKAVLAIYVPLTILAIALVPGATQEGSAWRGLASHKNTLGEIALVSTIVWAAGISHTGSKRKLWCALFAAASLVLVAGSRSTTSFVTLAFIAFLGLSVFLVRRLGTMFTAVAFSLCLACGTLIFVNVASVDTIFAGLGKDDTFTGRTDIWDSIIREAKLHPLQGAGFGGFWTPERDLGLYTPQESVWQPNEGHEGYLDLLNETGMVGVCLLALMVISCFVRTVKLKTWNLWMLLFIAVLMVNTMESTLFRAGSFTGWIFLLAYLGVQTPQFRPDSNAPRSGALPA